MRKNKYVTGKVITLGGPMLIAITFVETVEHRRMAQVFCDKAQSAGFYSVDDEGNVQVSGKSESLDIACRPGFDERLIASALFGTF